MKSRGASLDKASRWKVKSKGIFLRKKGNNMNLQITQMLGGGDSWFYLCYGTKILDSCHKDDAIGMKRLQDTKRDMVNKQLEDLKPVVLLIKIT